MLEKDLERKIVKYANELGIYNTKIQNIAGFPDRVFWRKGGKPLLMEVKKKGTGVLSQLQSYIIGKLLALGYQVEVVDTFERAKELFDDSHP